MHRSHLRFLTLTEAGIAREGLILDGPGAFHSLLDVVHIVFGRRERHGY